MRTRQKFLSELLGYSLKNIRRLEVKFDPFHPNSPNVREFWAGITDRKALKTNPELITKATIVSDQSDPLVTVHFVDNHKLVINGKYLESGHFLQLIKQFGASHQDESKDV
uniref:Large ribosomal subunit protein mL53 n=1 Tax=Aceria tosichella TaxID=561515 RepID=A0A6G1SNA8_9ACAR